MSSEKYTLPECLNGMTDLALNNNFQTTDTLIKSLLAKYPYPYARYMLDKTVPERSQSAADNSEQLNKYYDMITPQAWAKKD